VVALALVLAIRPVTVLASLAGTSLPRRERVFLAWFGVRGLASLYYAAVLLAAGTVQGELAELIWWTAVAAVVTSIVVHGISGPAHALRQRARA
jgi:NhaP-type Na+/H+ or K+/H+ antiporter